MLTRGAHAPYVDTDFRCKRVNFLLVDNVLYLTVTREECLDHLFFTHNCVKPMYIFSMRRHKRQKVELIKRMRQRSVPGSLFLLPRRELGYEANECWAQKFQALVSYVTWPNTVRGVTPYSCEQLDHNDIHDKWHCNPLWVCGNVQQHKECSKSF